MFPRLKRRRKQREKKIIPNLLANAAGGQELSSDDILRLFVEWIARYSQGHFRVIRSIYKNPGVTRQEMWLQIPRETVVIGPMIRAISSLRGEEPGKRCVSSAPSRPREP